MINYRISYVNSYGEERIAPFVFSNIQEARRTRKLYQDRGNHSVSILAYRTEDNNPINNK